MRRNQLFWGGALLLVGGLMLAGEMGIRLPNGNSLMSLLWPLLLIGFGVWVLLSVFMRGKVETQSANIGLQGAQTARVRINHGAGEMRLHSGASGSDLLRGTFAGGLEYKADNDNGRLNVKMNPANDFAVFPPFGLNEPLDWDVSFNPAIPISLDINMGANRSVLELRDLNVTEIKLKSGASDTVITLPAHGRLKLDCEIGAASLTVIVPEGVAIKARASLGAGDFHVDRTRFPSDESPDYASAPNAAEIYVKGGAASVKIK